jgi:hypothetical protein
MPIATQQPEKSTIEGIKSTLNSLNLGGTPTSLTSQAADSAQLTDKYSSFHATPATGTEFRSYSTDGKPTLSIREVLESDEKLSQLGKLV